MSENDKDIDKSLLDSSPDETNDTAKFTSDTSSSSSDSSTEKSKDSKGKTNTSKKKKKDKPKKEKTKKEKKPLNTKKLKYGTLATVFTLIITAIIVAINLIAQTITERFDLTIDLTENDIYSISDETITYLSGLDQDVQIIVLADESAFDDSTIYLKQAAEVIKKYALYSNNVSVEFIDINKNPNYVSKFKESYSGDLTEGNIVVYREATDDEDSDRIRVLTLSDLFTISSDSYGNTSVTESNAEQELTSAVMYVTDANPKKAVLISTSMPDTTQYAAQSLLQILNTNGYDLEEVDLLTEDLDVESTDLLLICSPLNDFNTAVIEKISDFLYNDGNLGKNVLYIANYNQNSTPNIDALLEEWGLSVGDYYIAESDSSASQTVGIYGEQTYIKSSIGVIANDDYADLVSDTSLPIAVPVSRPIDILWETNGDRETCTILMTSTTSALVPFDASSDFDITTAVIGEQNVMAMGTKYIFNDDNEKITSNVLVMGSAYMVDPYISQDSSYNNGEFILNAINKITGKSNGITIVPKSLSISTISIDTAQVVTIRTVVMLIVPLIIVAIGVVVYIRRRNR